MNRCIYFAFVLSLISWANVYGQNEFSFSPIIQAPIPLSLQNYNADKTQNKTNLVGQNLPYPVIFIHGLGGDGRSAPGLDGTWETVRTYFENTYGLTYGGRLDYNLNYDGNTSTSNITTDIGRYFTSANLQAGDFYIMNFNINLDGTLPAAGENTPSESNQSAIKKQGYALRDAISMILQVTGKYKVVLMGHSMGGLCSREYLQNPNLWYTATEHRVAQLATTGTPHGGSNASLTISPIHPTNENSEAVRDLRRSYYYSNNYGVYLYGGTESLQYMNDNLCCYFHNADVNCNGFDGESVVGLNTKNIDNTIPYSCIMGDCSGCPLSGAVSDGVVRVFDANINNFYSLNAEEFTYSASAITQIHTDLPGQMYLNMQALDEPDEYSQAFQIELNKTYKGFSTEQAINAPYNTDYDDYKFTLPANSALRINLSSIYAQNMRIRVVNSALNEIVEFTNGQYNAKDTTIRITNAGTYYLELESTPITNSWLNPHSFTLTRTSIVETENIENLFIKPIIFPNPASDKLNIQIDALGENKIVEIKVTNSLGQEVLSQLFTNQTLELDLLNLHSGVYFIQYIDNKKTIIGTDKFVKN